MKIINEIMKNTESQTSIRIQFHSFIFHIFLWAFVLALKWLLLLWIINMCECVFRVSSVRQFSILIQLVMGKTSYLTTIVNLFIFKYAVIQLKINLLVFFSFNFCNRLTCLWKIASTILQNNFAYVYKLLWTNQIRKQTNMFRISNRSIVQ